MVTYTIENPTPPQIIAFAQQQEGRPDRLGRSTTHPNGTQMHRFGACRSSDDVLVSPACGYPSMQQGIQPSPPHLKKR